MKWKKRKAQIDHLLLLYGLDRRLARPFPILSEQSRGAPLSEHPFDKTIRWKPEFNLPTTRRSDQ